MIGIGKITIKVNTSYWKIFEKMKKWEMTRKSGGCERKLTFIKMWCWDKTKTEKQMKKFKYTEVIGKIEHYFFVSSKGNDHWYEQNV